MQKTLYGIGMTGYTLSFMCSRVQTSHATSAVVVCTVCACTKGPRAKEVLSR